MEDDDFLWACALILPRNESFDIDFHGTGLLLSETALNFSQSTYSCQNKTSNDDALVVRVLEERGNGVIDTIGGEIWEAALLLCGLIMQEASLWTAHRHVVELGSGVGLPALLLAQLNARLQHMHPQQHVVLTDYNPKLLQNLDCAVRGQFTASPCPDRQPHCPLLVTIAQLDWSLFTADAPKQSLTAALQADQVDLIFGSALCYEPSHAELLLQLIQYYLHGGCREVVILQIADRAGFQSLISQLQALPHVVCRIEPIREAVYAYAGHITRRQLPGEGDTIAFEYQFPAYQRDMQYEAAPSGLLRTDRQAFALLRVSSSSRHPEL